MNTLVIIVAVLMIVFALLIRLLQWRYNVARKLLQGYLTQEWQSIEHLIDRLQRDGVEGDKVLVYGIMKNLEISKICQHRDRKLPISTELDIDLTVREYRLVTRKISRVPPIGLYCC